VSRSTGRDTGARVAGEESRVVRMAGEEVTPALRALIAALDPTAPGDYRELAAALAQSFRAHRPRRIGLAGGQGTGKSTLSRLLERACDQVGIRACVLSLDDYYLPRAERLALARRVHRLFETRGPPGTHDVALCRAQMTSLSGNGEIELPVFDKGRDDRVGIRRVSGPFDLVVLEGWCVGAGSVDEVALAVPVNALERESDPDRIWRRHANDALATGYAALWADLDQVVFLRAPDLAAVVRWRLEQEAERPVAQRMGSAAIDRFVQHYERTTLEMMGSLPDRADWTIELGPDHAITAIRRRVSDW
jgi:D-glycerate 3-kinase